MGSENLIEIGDALWMRLQEMLTRFSARLSNLDSELRCSVVRWKSEAFLLRGYFKAALDGVALPLEQRSMVDHVRY